MNFFEIDFNECYKKKSPVSREISIIKDVIESILKKSFNRCLKDFEEESIIKLIDFYKTKYSKSNKEIIDEKIKFLEIILNIYKKNNFYENNQLDNKDKRQILDFTKLMFLGNILGKLTIMQELVVIKEIKTLIKSKRIYKYKTDDFSKKIIEYYEKQLEMLRQIFIQNRNLKNINVLKTINNQKS